MTVVKFLSNNKILYIESFIISNFQRYVKGIILKIVNKQVLLCTRFTPDFAAYQGGIR